MIYIIILLIVIALVTFWAGYRQMVRLEQLNRDRVIHSLLALLLLLTLMSILHWVGLVSQAVAARITMGLYGGAAGFFFGYGTRLIRLHTSAGRILYMNRSFWIDVAPNLISIALFVFGIYRTGILSLGPFTGIGITSGLSLIGFAYFGWTVRIVPELRSEGILLLDQIIPWNDVISYEWSEEEAVQIDYMTGDGAISAFTTYIPEEDTLAVERLLEEKLLEHRDEPENGMREKEGI